MTSQIESLFISHGAPTFALEPGPPGAALRKVGEVLGNQGTQALIVLSPHWRSARLEVTSHAAPVIVHDFYGFPAPLYSLKPDISGAPELANVLIDALNGQGHAAQAHPQQGFDHGAWVPYLHLFPYGGPSMLQISMPIDLDNQRAYELGRIVGEFARANKAVVIGSGSLTHNFKDMDLGSTSGSRDAPDYVAQFTEWISKQLSQQDDKQVLQADRCAPHFHRAHPDDDHFLPLPFAMGAASAGREVIALPEEVRYKALSMQSYVFSAAG